MRQSAKAFPRAYRIALILTLFSVGALAENVSDSKALLCYGWTASMCDTDNGCKATEPWRLNLPDFVRIDLTDRVIKTTPTAAQARTTAIRTLQRQDGILVLQGHQNDRAFSWLIAESTGEGTLTVSEPGVALSVFTICKPTK